MGEQGGLTGTRWLVHHDELPVRGFQTAKHLVGCPLLPWGALSAEVAEPKIREILQRPPGLLHERGIHELPSDRVHPEGRGSLQPGGCLIAALKPVRGRHGHAGALSGLLDPEAAVTGIEVPLPLVQINLLHATPEGFRPERGTGT